MLADNGGKTLTHALNPNSPAIDAASPVYPQTFDQRGFKRPADGNGDGLRRNDIGAFERNAAPPYCAFDFDGDAKADISVFRAGSGFWYLSRSSQGFTGAQFGTSGDKIVPADYDGDGRADIAVYRPIDGVWYLLQLTGGFRALQFGVSEDVPVTGDFDGDGSGNLSVFRPSANSWYIARPSGQASQNFDTIVVGIIGTDKPVSSAFVY